MFKKGFVVKCVILDDETADGKHQASLALLSKDSIYHVLEYDTPIECARLFPEQRFWEENGGRMILQEHPKLRFFGKRFAAANAVFLRKE